MKTLPYIGLTDSQKSYARKRVADVLVKMARDSGRICAEDSKEVASRATYTMTRSGWIWGIVLPENLQWLNQIKKG